MHDHEYKLSKLEKQITGKKSILVSFSGGIDSVLLAIIVKRTLGRNHLCVLINSPLVPKKDVERSLEIAHRYDLNLKIIDCDLLKILEIKKNERERCYHCKKEMMRLLNVVSAEYDLQTIMDGTNRSDLEQYRPGIKATLEEGVEHPFADAGITKEDIRKISRDMDIDIWDLPSSACLASRIPYNEIIDQKKLETIEEGELFLRNIGFEKCRLRINNGEFSKIEVPQDVFEKIINKKDTITSALKDLGIKHVTLDLEGYRSGSFDKT